MTTLYSVPQVDEDDAPPARPRTPRRIRSFTPEDRFAAVGSVLASLALVDVAYLHIFYFISSKTLNIFSLTSLSEPLKLFTMMEKQSSRPL